MAPVGEVLGKRGMGAEERIDDFSLDDLELPEESDLQVRGCRVHATEQQ